METTQTLLLVAATGAFLLTLVCMIVILKRLAGVSFALDHGPVLAQLSSFDDGQQRLERTVRDDLRTAREEEAASAKHLREEVGTNIKGLTDTLLKQSAEMSRQQKEQFEGFSQQLRRTGSDSALQMQQNQEALGGSIREIRERILQHLEALQTAAAAQSKSLSESVAASLDRFAETSREHSQQLFAIQKRQHDDFARRMTTLSETQAKVGESLRQSVDAQLTVLRKDNVEKLEQMRVTVDEKLQGTLEQRLGESFKIVSERLEAVHQGLGEMQALATGVGDLKRVLTNVKARGSWGEVQLGALLEQILTPAQYAANVAVSALSNERVEYAIRLPGRDTGEEVLLPIDAKFPIEDYERLQAASEAADLEAVENAHRALEARIKASARDICSKYVQPPRTTDFAIMFLPTEGLYAEVIRRPGLCDELQRTCRVVVAGPTTLTAILNSLQMGFRTLAIQQRSSEVWQVLAAVKTEFGKFGPVLDKVKKKLQEASNHIDKVEVRGRAINRQLRQVEAAPSGDAVALLEVVEDDFGIDPEEDDPRLVASEAAD